MSTVHIGRDDTAPYRYSHDHHKSHGDSLLHSERRQPKTLLPIMPDLRFEYTYLRNIRRHVHVERVKAPAQADAAEKSETEESAQETEVVRVAWGNVVWITFKEQFLMPLIQGLVWGAVRWYVVPSAAIFGQNFRAWWERGNALASRRRGDRQSIDGVRNLVFPRTS